jgi:hypothetical protein
MFRYSIPIRWVALALFGLLSLGSDALHLLHGGKECCHGRHCHTTTVQDSQEHAHSGCAAHSGCCSHQAKKSDSAPAGESLGATVSSHTDCPVCRLLAMAIPPIESELNLLSQPNISRVEIPLVSQWFGETLRLSLARGPPARMA